METQPKSDTPRQQAVHEEIMHRVAGDGRFAWVEVEAKVGLKAIARVDRGVRSGSPVLLLLENESIPQYMWPAAAPFAQWIIRHRSLFEGKRVLELGSGVGFAGFSAAAAGASTVVFSDCSPVSRALVELAILENAAALRTLGTRCLFQSLRWGSIEQLEQLRQQTGIAAFDVVIGCDVFYFNSSLRNGILTAKEALVPGGDFCCGSVVRSDRMEADIDDVPMELGLRLSCKEEEGPLLVYHWNTERDD